jgi:hypothetical protein
MVAPDTAKDGVLHAVVDDDIHILLSQAFEPIEITPELDTDPNVPLNETVVEPVVGTLVALTCATMAELNERELVKPGPAMPPVVTTIKFEARDSGARRRQFSTESEVHKDLRKALTRILTLDECEPVPKLSPDMITNTDPVKGTLVPARLDTLGPSNDVIADIEPACCRTVTRMLSDDLAPDVTLTRVSESLLQKVAIMDEDNLVMTLLSLVAKFEPTTLRVELPLDGIFDTMLTPEGAGT